MAYFFLVFSLLSGTGVAVETDVVYYLTGQLHPLVEVHVELNGKQIKSFRPESGRSKVFLKQIDAGMIKPGRNEMIVHWEILEGEAAEGHAFGKSGYRISLKHQKDPTDRRTAIDLVRVAGIEVPLPAPGSTGSDRLHFQTLVQ